MIPRCQWHRGIRLLLPPLIFTFSSYHMYAMFTYVFFCYGFPLKGMRANNRCRNWSRGGIKDLSVSMIPLNPLPLSHWDYGIFYKNVQVRS
jgi:hypothetical protein